jgi:predicted RNase H-like nuclease (RuvC/YqgF family)
MVAGEKDIANIKQKYEAEIKTLESEMDRMQREKDQLMQQVKNEPMCGKLAEQRRKRIQELEQSIQVII